VPARHHEELRPVARIETAPQTSCIQSWTAKKKVTQTIIDVFVENFCNMNEFSATGCSER